MVEGIQVWQCHLLACRDYGGLMPMWCSDWWGKVRDSILPDEDNVTKLVITYNPFRMDEMAEILHMYVMESYFSRLRRRTGYRPVECYGRWKELPRESGRYNWLW